MYGLEIPEFLDEPVQQQNKLANPPEEEIVDGAWLEENHSLINFPNPFTAYTTIKAYISKEADHGRIVIYDLLGVLVREYIISPGYNAITVLAEDLPTSGIYFCNLEVNRETVAVGKMTYLK